MICDEECLRIIKEKISNNGIALYGTKDSLFLEMEGKSVVIENDVFSAKTKIKNLNKIVWKDGDHEVIFPDFEVLKDFHIKIISEERVERYGHWSHMPYYLSPFSIEQPQYHEVEIPYIYNNLIITNKSLS